MKRAVLLILVSCALTIGSAQSQSPVPVVVPAATSTAPVRSSTTGDTSADLTSTLKQLQQLKQANDQLIQQQTATLEQLNELQQAAEQLRIFSRRS